MRPLALIFLWVIGTVGLVLWGLAYGGVNPEDLGVLDYFNLSLCIMPSIITLVMAIEGPPKKPTSNHPSAVTLHYVPPSSGKKKKGKAH